MTNHFSTNRMVRCGLTSMVGCRGWRRRGSGLLRGVVVAAATLAILLVCFSMYEFSASDREADKDVPRERLPDLPSELSQDDVDRLATGEGGIAVGDAKLGKAQEISISIYSREGARAALEITVSDWVPRDGSDHEFTLKDPDIRMRTNDGNDVRVTATEGMLDAKRKSSGGLDPRRGWLTGNVVIEFDRRTDADKAALSVEERDHPGADDLVRVETETLEFDLEYDKLIVPGKLKLTASDFLFEADDLEIRFNEAEGRVEALRISRGGAIELLGDGKGLGVSMPGADASPTAKTTIVEWIRATIERRLALRDAAKNAADDSGSGDGSLPGKTADGVPIFRAGSGEDDGKADRAPVRYLARFEDDVDVRQMSGGKIASRLKADALEVLRDFGDREKNQVRSKSGEGGEESPKDDGATSSAGKIYLTWSGRLALDALGPDHVRYAEGGRAKILAYGAPAELSGVDGEAVCTELSFTPDRSSLELVGTDAIPVVVRSVTQGNLMGRSVSLRREGERFNIDMTGPGVVSGDMAGMASGDAGAQKGSIRFGKTLAARGRVVRRTVPDFTGTIRTIESRLLEEVVVTGQSSVIREDTGLNADRVEFSFGSRRGWSRDSQYLRRLSGRGDVVMTFGSDRTTSDAIEVSLAPTADGRSLPTVAVATGNVVAVQSDRTLRASEKLVVDFTHVSTPVGGFADSDAVVSADGGSGPLDGGDGTGRLTAQASRLRAYGEVSVFDPEQGLDVTADRLDCSIADGRGIETANIFGGEDAPASVRTDTFSVVGGEIELDVATEHAKVPGSGRMTFQSQRDLDGGRSDHPVPIAITWNDRMEYEGTRNVANFYGKVHAASDAHTTFDCEQLRAEFGDVVQTAPVKKKASGDWGIVKLFSDSAGITKSRDRGAYSGKMSGKELTSIHAWGDAVALTSEMNETTGELKSRARLVGPKLSVNLRGEVSKMLIEGPGTLMLEDFEIPEPGKVEDAPVRGDLFGSSKNSGPSKTLVGWKGRMWYDFSIDQVRFEESVDLKHFSGQELAKAFRGAAKNGVELPAGRRTFLASDILTVDFRDRAEKSRDPSSRRMGRLASDQLKRFHASGNVDLQDSTDGLWLTSEDLVFERDRSILVIEGGATRKARIIKQEVGKLPTHVDGARFFYNLKTGRLDVSKPGVRGG